MKKERMTYLGGKHGGWAVVQTIGKRRYVYDGHSSQANAQVMADSFARMDRHIGRKGVTYNLINFGAVKKKNPSPTSKAIRRQLRKRAKPPKKRNPAQHWYIHIQKHGQGPVMLFNGVSFSSPENRKPQPFATANAAMYKARHLLGKYHRHLRAYKIWVSDQHYGAPTQAGRVNPRKRLQRAKRKNPESLDQAARKLEDFTGREASDTIKAPARSNEKTGLVIGELKAVEYIAAREGIEGGKPVRWHHKFRKGSRPLLATTTDGKQLHVVGGQYEFTEAGIEDR